jgi:hypothetical protein
VAGVTREVWVPLSREEIEVLRLGLALLVGECPPDHSAERAHRLDDMLRASLDALDLHPGGR